MAEIGAAAWADEVSSVHLSASPGCSQLYLPFFRGRNHTHQDATAMGTEGEEAPVSSKGVERGKEE